MFLLSPTRYVTAYQFFLAHELNYVVPVRSCAVEWQWLPDLCAEPRHGEFLDNTSTVSRIMIGR